MDFVSEAIANEAVVNHQVNNLPWTKWTQMPSPEDCKSIKGPIGPGVYQIRDSLTSENIQFGIGIKCLTRMLSLYPPPYGSGTRKNNLKRNFILVNNVHLEYRTLATTTRSVAKIIEDYLKSLNNHRFNT